MRQAVSIARRLGRKARALGQRRIASIWPRGVVSFTFDDFPKSAFTNGAPVLERHGARGTYYTAFGLADRAEAVGEMFDLECLRSVLARGHEIGCHTYSHLNCARAGRADLWAELVRNARAIAAVSGGQAMTSFSYPFGVVSPDAKAVTAGFFSSCRGIEPGINLGVPDYAALRANKIYAGQYDPQNLRALVDRNGELGGWLIFYTHDVGSAPSPYGCTQAQLEEVVAYAAERGPVRPMGDVVAHMGSRARRL
jgi:peptidoglycan/xylan/chitin deacetylase (PgdA/CDA1 family)